jgi:uncharacterized protein (DUF302 family)
MCLPRSAYKILKVNKKLGVMMPLQITIYEEDGQVYCSWLNIDKMGKMMGSTIAEVMKKSSDDLINVLKEIIILQGE